MSNRGYFTGRVARPIDLREGRESHVCYFTLIRDDYAGVDAAGTRSRTVTLPLKAFGKRAQLLARKVNVGDQLMVEYSIRNRVRRAGELPQFEFIVRDFDFGAPGQITRERWRERETLLAQARSRLDGEHTPSETLP